MNPSDPQFHGQPELVSGRAHFEAPELASLATSQGQAAAWRAAFKSGAPNALAGVRGEFAVGMSGPQGSVFLAVDRFASHPVCYRVVGDRLLFGARADELARRQPAADIDPQALFDYLYFHVIPSPKTIFKGVYRLPPGHCATFIDGQLAVARYWHPRFEEPASVNFEASAEEFRRLLRASVAEQLDGTKPACFLSGGTDSSTVAGLVGEVGGRAAASYSIGFDAEGYDEMQFARIAARRFGTEHHEYYVTPEDLINSVPAVAAHFDQPFGNSSVLPAYYCALMARDDGVSKLLAGDGGDELFGGNSRYAKQRVFGWYQHMPATLRTGMLEPALERTRLGSLPLARKARSYVEQARLPMPERLELYNLLLRIGSNRVFTADFLASVDTGGPLRHQVAVWEESEGSAALNRMLAYDWRFTLSDADLPKVRGATSLAGVSVGFPFLAQSMVDFSSRLPAEYKLKRLKLRWFFKEALRGFLPEEIIQKKKQGFGLPFGVWANSHTGLRSMARELLHGLVERHIVKETFITDLLGKQLPSHPGYYGEMVWILMMLEQWMQYQSSARSSVDPDAGLAMQAVS